MNFLSGNKKLFPLIQQDRTVKCSTEEGVALFSAGAGHLPALIISGHHIPHKNKHTLIILLLRQG